MRKRDFSGGLFPAGGGPPRVIEPKEGFISRAIAAWLEKHGCYTDRLNSGKIQAVKRFRRPDGPWQERRDWVQLCRKGTPDRFFILGGKIGFVEVKRRGMKPTPEQLEMHDRLRRAGAWVIVADSLFSFIHQFRKLLE